jgi:hypothetical protein
VLVGGLGLDLMVLEGSGMINIFSGVAVVNPIEVTHLLFNGG